MKNALVYGLIIAALNGAWIVIAYKLGLRDIKDNHWGIGDYIIHLLPAVVLYVGLRAYRKHEEGGRIGYLGGIVQGFKILLIGGVVSIIFAIFYLDWAAPGKVNMGDFSGRILNSLFAAIGFTLLIPLLLINSTRKIE